MADVDESRPVMLFVPIGEYSETDLMAALDSLVSQWGCWNIGDGAEKARAVDWLHAKYGSKAR